MKILISLSKLGLRLVKENYRQARGNKHAGTMIINPHNFLTLTTRNDKEIAWILDEAKTLDDYNSFTKQGDSSLMPWLEISIDGIDPRRDWIRPGSIVGHEGRHRAAALIKEGINKMPISVNLYRKGRSERYKTTDADPWSTDPWTSQDLPKVLYGQFNEYRTVHIDASTFKALR